MNTRLRVMAETSLEEQTALVALLQERPGNRSWSDLASTVLELGSAVAARRCLVPESLFEDAIEARAREHVRTWANQGLAFWTIASEDYPSRVRDIVEAPPFLFGKGQPEKDDVAVSVVGSRKATPRGLGMATSIAELLVSMGVTVIAGLAAGIDTQAHETALSNGGRTVAVLGTGIRRSYPAANRALQEQIADTGLLLSQFWPDAPPQRHSFPMRNAVMSGYGLATIVVEAGEQSGARIQARLAVQHGRPVILTSLVVNSTEWGKALVGRPDVHVAASIDEVKSLVEDLIRRPNHLTEALNEIVV